MENKIIEEQKKQLIDSLSPLQKKYLEAIDWLFNGARATGRSHLICVTALLHVLNGQDGIVIEHVPYWHEGMKSYTKTLLFSLAGKIGLRIKVHDTRTGFIVSRVPEEIIYMERTRSNRAGTVIEHISKLEGREE